MKRKTRFIYNSDVKKGASGLLFLCKSILTIISLIWISATVTYAQSGCSITLSATSSPAYCQADGAIYCTLSDTTGEALEQIRYSFIPLDHGLDSIVETSNPFVMQLRPGHYKVKVEALCATGLSGVGAYTIIGDSIESVEVESRYSIPTSRMIYNLFIFDRPYGIVPSFVCQPTGQVQVRLEEGTFPYTVDIWRCTPHDTFLVRSVVFDSCQHSGDNPNRFDYKHYYTIDSLDIGDYKLLCHDGCGYYTPAVFVSVPKVRYDTSPSRHLLRNSSGDPYTYNIVTFKEIFHLSTSGDHNDEYYYYISGSKPTYEYRFINPTPDGERDTTEWRVVIPPDNGTVFLHDTMARISSYCEAWFDTIQLQLRHLPCPDTVLNYDFVLYPQGNNRKTHALSSVYEYKEDNYYDLCGFNIGKFLAHRLLVREIRYHQFAYCYNWDDSTDCASAYFYTEPGGITDIEDGMMRHSFITAPVRCIVTDVTQHRVLDTVKALFDTYDWYIQIPVDSNLTGDSILLEMFDAKGCPVTSDLYVSTHDGGTTIGKGGLIPYDWSPLEPESNLCDDRGRSIGIEQNTDITRLDTIYGHNAYNYSGDTIYLVGSPDSNFYNFKAYIDSVRHYKVEKARMENDAIVEYAEFLRSNGMRTACIKMRGDHLPSGTYTWVVVHACDQPNDTIVQEVLFPEPPVITEDPKYTFTNRCSQLEIVPLAGQFQLDGVPMNTFFQIHTEDTIIHSANSVGEGEPMYIGVPGTYILSMYALPENYSQLPASSPCFIKDTLVVWGGETIKFDYLISYVCNDRDTMGFVHARGKNGTLPYTYTVYDAPNGTGNILGQNHIGDFDTLAIHYGQALSIEMTDACDAHFITNFVVSDLEKIRKGWAENHLNQLSLCGGGVCHFYGIALGEVTYHWTGPNGFESHLQNPVLDIPAGSHPDGIYRIEVLGTGCGPLRDSIQLEIITQAYLELSRDTAVCAGETVPIIIAPHGTGPFSYTITRQDGDSIRAFVFTDRPAGSADTLYETVVKSGIRYYATQLEDQGCMPGALLDTVTLTMYAANGSDTLRDTIHEEELPYLWGGLLFTQADTITTHLTGLNGCDSSVTHILEVIPAPVVDPIVYGPCPEAIDYDGYHYPSVRIDRYCWTQVNLRSRHYSDGREIVVPMSYHSDMHPDSVGNVDLFGHLYTWYAAIDTANGGTPTPGGHYQGICPEGWFLPDSIHYAELSLHGAPALRSPLYWINGSGGDNSTGFTALPAGFYNGKEQRYENLLGETRFWSTYHNISSEKAQTLTLYHFCEETKNVWGRKDDGCSIRCILEE